MKNSLVTAMIILSVTCASAQNAGTVSGSVLKTEKPAEGATVSLLRAKDSSTVKLSASNKQGVFTFEQIADGKYSATMPVGEKRLSISSSKVVGQRKMYEMPNSPMVDNTQELLPPKYNVQSTLTLTIKPGTQEQPLDLTSK